jgi:hypothetical protein
LLGSAEDRRRKVACGVSVEKADHLQAVLRMRLDLAEDEASLVAAADDQRAARRHHTREDPAADRSASDRDEDERRTHEEERLDGRVNPPVEEVVDRLRDDQVPQRADQQRVQEVADLVEARDGDPQVVVVVELVRREDAEPDDGCGDPEHDEEPGVRRDRRKRRDAVGDGVRRRVRDEERQEVDACEHPGPATAEPARRSERRRTTGGLRPGAHSVLLFLELGIKRLAGGHRVQTRRGSPIFVGQI